MCAYLTKYHNAEMVYDPTDPEIDMTDFLREYWSLSIYEDSMEEFRQRFLLGSLALETGLIQRGKGLQRQSMLTVILGITVTQRSRTGVDVFRNSDPCYCLSRKQGICEIELKRVFCWDQCL